jgi:hypothetical protein
MSQTTDKVRAKLQARADKLTEKAMRAAERVRKAKERLEKAQAQELRIPKNATPAVRKALKKVREYSLYLLECKVQLAEQKHAAATEEAARPAPTPVMESAARVTASQPKAAPSFCRDNANHVKHLTKAQTDAIKRVLGRRLTGVLTGADAETVLAVLDDAPNLLGGTGNNAADCYAWTAKDRKNEVRFETEEDGLKFWQERA